MSATTALAGLSNQTRREAGTWWRTRRWWTQALLWIVLTNGLLAMMLWVIPRLETLEASALADVSQTAAQFTGMAAMLASVGVVVLAQGLLIDERRLGLLEWMLSKPLARPALLLAKYGAHATAMLVVVVLVPWVGVAAQLSAAEGARWPIGRTLGAVALIGMLVLFHLALVLALSTAFWSRGGVLALPLAGIVGTDLLVSAVPRLAEVLPWSLGRVAGAVLSDGVLVSVWPVVATVGWTVLCLVAAVWRMQRTEL